MYECPNCGGNLRFDIPSQQLACRHCGTKASPYEVEKETDATQQEFFEATVFTCPQCAGEILSADNEAAAFCSFCGASTILSGRISKEKRPKYIIPFKKTKEDCKAAYAKKMRTAFFVPDELRDAKFIDGFRGIYMPYWTYQLTQKDAVRFEGKQSHRRGDYIITEHYDLTGDLNAYYLGYSRDASSSFYDNISEKLAPYNAKELVNFTPSFLSGFYADTADVEEDVYLEDVVALADDSSFKKICARPEFSGYGIDSATNKSKLRSEINTKCRSADSTMYPVWFLSYRNKDRVAYATVNGQTGKVVADMPIDSKKYVLSSLILAVILFALLNLFFTIRPVTLLGFACMLVIVSAITYAVELDAIWRKESNADDIGVLAAMEKETFEYKVDRWMEKGETPQETETRKRRASKAYSVKRKKELRPGDWLKKHGIPLFIILISFGPVILLFASYLIWPIIMITTVISCIVGMNNGNKLEDLRKSPGFIISLVTVAIAMLIRLLNPVSDIYYYAGAMLNLFAVLFNMIDVIRNYNRLAMRRLPQFDKQGGDDRA